MWKKEEKDKKIRRKKELQLKRERWPNENENGMKMFETTISKEGV